jgi:hypothetical protein
LTTERIVRIVAGTFVVASFALGEPASPLFVHHAFVWLALFVGANLLQSGFTQICPLESILKTAGVRSCSDAARSRPLL